MKNFNPDKFGLKPHQLYEILATTFIKEEGSNNVKPNTSCMGIRMLDDGIININPFPDTRTFKNLKQYGFVTLNFVDNVYLFCLAALKEEGSKIGIERFPEDLYEFKELTIENKGKSERQLTIIPYVKSAWGVLIGMVVNEEEKIRKDNFGETRLTEFNLKVLDNEKLKESYKLFNRAENLTLESIILATRIKVAKRKDDQELLKYYLKQLDSIAETVMRISDFENIIKTIKLVQNYVYSS